MGFSEDDVQLLMIELNFWLGNPHPSLTPIHEIIQEDPFIYIIYESPVGGAIESLIFKSDAIFSESFAKFVATNILEGLAFLHLKGVVHGNCLPNGIYFQLDQNTPGWAQTAQLSTLRVNYLPNSTSFIDLKDLAYTLCAVLRRGTGVFSRADFNPIIITTTAWSFVSPEFKDFIKQLWNADKNAKGAEFFTEHAWLHAKPKLITKADVSSKVAQLSYKINTKKSPFKRRKWVGAWGKVEASTLLLSGDEAGVKGPADLLAPFGLNLKGLQLCVTVTRYTYTFALQKRDTLEIVLWLRFKTLEKFDEFKLAINEFTDPAIPEPGTTGEAAARYRASLTKSVQARDYLKRGSMLSGVSVFGGDDLASRMKASKKTAATRQERKEMLEEGSIVPDAGSDGEGKSAHPLQSLAWDQHQRAVEAVDAAAQRVMYSLQSQGIVYRRSTAIRCGWSYGKGGSLAPYPSEKRAAIHPGKKWDARAEEFLRVIKTGRPLSSKVEFGEQWFVVDASWFRHWKRFISSTRRMVPPPPIDNLWMVSSSSSCLIEGLIEDTDDAEGDFRVVTPQIWTLFEELYGGGPPISFVGPPVGDVNRWTVHFAGINNEGALDVDDFMEEFSDHESDVNSEEGVLHIDLENGQKASMDELIKIAELFGFEDVTQDVEGDDDIRLVNVEEGMGELFDYLEAPEKYVDNLEVKKKKLFKRASTMGKRRKSGRAKVEETEDDRVEAIQHMIHRDFAEEESDSEASVDSWSDEIVALKQSAPGVSDGNFDV